MSNKIIVFDTTLRDGEQSPGATMTRDEKIAVADLLANMGVDVIEAGFAAASAGDLACIAAIGERLRQTTVCSLARAITYDIEQSAKALEKAHKPRIHTFISTSDIHIEYQLKQSRTWVLDKIAETVRLAKSYVDDIEWSAMDATRSDMNFLIEAVGVAIQSGAQTINIPDTVGYTMPEEYHAMMKNLSETYPQAIFSVHCHNDLGLATANSLAGILGGARQIECTINGIGERAGNAALEEVIMALNTRPDIYPFQHKIDSKHLWHVSRFVASVTGFSIQKNKAIVGLNAFAHESGIHQDGMIKNRNTYEIMTPESVGVPSSQIILGKHSGRAALKTKILEWGWTLNEQDLDAVFQDFKNLCDIKKNVVEEDVFGLIQQRFAQKSKHHIQLQSFTTSKDHQGHYQAEVSLKLGDQYIQTTATGDGPLDAIFKAVSEQAKIDAELTSFEIHSLSHGRDAQAECILSLAHRNKNFSGHARDTDTLMAAVKAYIYALNKILSTSEPSIPSEQQDLSFARL